jgi:hypothetical protein
VTPTLYVQVSLNPISEKHDGSSVMAAYRTSSDPYMKDQLGKVGISIFGGTLDILGPGLVEQMTAAKVGIVDDVIGGHGVVRLDFEDDWGIHSLWLDPDHGYNPLRITQHKLARHFIRPGVRLDQTPEDRDNGQMNEIHTDVVVTSFEHVHETWYAVNFEVKTKTITNRSKALEVRQVFDILDVGPDSSARGNQFRIMTPVSNGTRVSVIGQRPIVYEWHDGIVEKSVNQPLANSLAQQQFSTSGRWRIWLAGGVILAAGYAFFEWQRRRRLARMK